MCYEDYENYIPDDEFSMQINELIIEEINTRMKQTVEELKVYKSQSEELQKQLWDNQNEFRKFKFESDEKLKLAIKEKELEVKREFGKGFTVNDTVYYIASNREERKCEKCDGRGEVEIEVLGKRTKVKCPHCTYGKVITYDYYPKEDKIRSIKFWLTRKDNWDKKSSGVFSDTNIEIWLESYDNNKKVENLYKTKEECQVACDEKNNKKAL